eukprot:40435_1
MVSQGQTNEETKEKDSKQSKIQWKQKAMLGEMHHLSRSTMVNIQKTKSTRRSQRRRIDRRKRDLEQKKVENIDGRHWMLLEDIGYGGVGVLNENIMEMKTVLLLVVMVVVISMKEKSVLFVVIRIVLLFVLSLVTLQCDIIGNAKIGFVLQSCADSHGKQELESITNCIKRCRFDCGFRQPISMCFDFDAL